MGKAATNKRRAHVREAVSYLWTYWETYANQIGYEDYSDEVIIDDALYGLGVALWGDEHRFAQGHDGTLRKLKKHIDAALERRRPIYTEGS